MKRRVAALLIMSILAVSALAGCNTGGTANNMEITEVVFVRTGGDVDKTEAFILKPDLTLEHAEFKPGLSFSDGNELMALLDKEPGSTERLQMPEDAWQSIVLEAKRVDFMTMPEEIETLEQVFDGSAYYIYLETTNGSHVSGGYEAGNGMDSDNRRFGYLREYIEIAIEESTPQDD